MALNPNGLKLYRSVTAFYTWEPAMSSTSLTPPDDLLPLIETAAELRAVGNSWANIAKKLDRCERTVRCWKTVYRRHWQRLFREAEDDIFQQVACMATTTMANLVINY